MALDVKFSICQSSNCKVIDFTETTGIYNATTNLTGWGAVGGADPNPMLSDATTATLLITGPDGTVYPTVDLFALGGFPKDVSTVSGSITATSLSPSMTTFADGLWEMTYSVTTTGAKAGTFTETISFFFSCTIEKCVCNLIAAMDINDCTCDPDRMNEALKAKAFVDAMHYAVGCANLDGANEILKSLTRICSC